MESNNSMNTRNNIELAEFIVHSFPGKIISHNLSYEMITIAIQREDLTELLQALYKHEELQFQFLTDLCGVHFPDEPNDLGVVYHLHSMIYNYRLRVKVLFSSADPVVDSQVNLFSSANWMERETFDFFGIQFKGHPNLKRILNMDDLGYHPMLKQYPLEDASRIDKEDKYFGR